MLTIRPVRPAHCYELVYSPMLSPALFAIFHHHLHYSVCIAVLVLAFLPLLVTSLGVYLGIFRLFFLALSRFLSRWASLTRRPFNVFFIFMSKKYLACFSVIFKTFGCFTKRQCHLCITLAMKLPAKNAGSSRATFRVLAYDDVIFSHWRVTFFFINHGAPRECLS